MIIKYIFYMLVDSGNTYIVQHCHHFLRQPDVFIFIAHFKALLVISRSGNKGKILRRT